MLFTNSRILCLNVLNLWLSSKDLKTKFVERFSVWKKKCTHWYQIIATPLTYFFKILLFCLGKKCYCVIFVCLWKRILIFFFPVCSSLFLPGCSCQFSASNCRQAFSFLQFLTDLSTKIRQFIKKQIICLQHFDVLMILSQPCTTVQPGHWKLSQIHLTIHTIIPPPCYLRLNRSFLANEFSENVKVCCKINVNYFSRLIHPYLM